MPQRRFGSRQLLAVSATPSPDAVDEQAPVADEVLTSTGEDPASTEEETAATEEETTAKEGSSSAADESSTSADPIPEGPPPIATISTANLALSRNYSCVQLTEPTEDGIASYIVELQPDVNLEEITEHMERIQQLCTEIEETSVGIEAHLDTVISGYVGVFTQDLIEVISKDSDIVRSITANQAAEVYGDTITMKTANWGASRISLDGSNWKPSLKADGKWPYRVSRTEKDGYRTAIFLIDEGDFDRSDFIQPSRILAGDCAQKAIPASHASMMANVMAGDTFGLARRAKFWLYNPTPKLSKVSVLLAWEAIAKFDFEAANVKAGAGIMCLPFGFADTPKENHPLARALAYLVHTKDIKVVVAAPNNHVHVEEYQCFPQNVEELILVGGSCQHNRLASTSDWSNKITLYAPAEDIPVVKSALSQSETENPLTWTGYNPSKGTATGNCFGAAHVCGVISLILSDDDYAVKQAQLKSALMDRFSETTEIKTAGKVPIRVLKKFMQSIKKQSKSRRSSAHHVSTEASDTTSLRIHRLALGKYQIELCDADSVNSTMLNKSQFAELMIALQAETPVFKTMATILGDSSSDGQGAVAKAVSQVTRVTVSWELRQESRFQHVKQKNVAGEPEEFLRHIGEL